MTQSLRTFNLLILVFCFVKPAEAQVTALTPDDTAAYVNATLHKFPTLEFVDSGCPGYEQVVMISSDRQQPDYQAVLWQINGRKMRQRSDVDRSDLQLESGRNGKLVQAGPTFLVCSELY